MSGTGQPNEGRKLLSEYRLDPNADLSSTFGLEPPNKPYKKVALAVGLLVLGSVMLFTGVGLFVTGGSNGAWAGVRACMHMHVG